MLYCVYCHVNRINGKKYYGQTHWIDNPNKRWNNGKGYQNNKHFSDSINKYGWDNFDHIIIKTNITLEEANELETEMILRDKTYLKENGYNNDYGGNNKSLTDFTKKKISEANKNPSKEVREKLSISAKKRVGDKNSFYGKHHSQEAKDKISKSKKGKPVNRKNYKHSLETRIKIRLSRLGKKPWNKGKTGLQSWTDDQRINYRKTVGKKVKCVETDTIYACIKEASEITNILSQNICEVCKGKRKTAGGFHWEYYCDSNNQWAEEL